MGPFNCPLQPDAAGACHLYEGFVLPTVSLDHPAKEPLVSCRHLSMAEENAQHRIQLRCAFGDAKSRRDHLA